ncbi:S8 family serine peptidase [Herbiconiux sp. 11R-BC]|uniref:S8 family serine peptidase n=1 Tax=Herbiconiux sp. 11R-BC TaxID=3111637 RepID=UPI003C01225B
MGDAGSGLPNRAQDARRGRGAAPVLRASRLGAGVMAAVFAAMLLAPAAAQAEPAAAADASADASAESGSSVETVGLSDRLEALTALPAGTDLTAPSTAGELGLADTGAGSLQVDRGAVAVSILYRVRPSAADFAALAALGTVEASSAELARASAFVPPANLAAVAALPGVASVTEALRPGDSGVVGSAGAASAELGAIATAASCRAVEAVGATALNAELAGALHGVDGTGVTVGIISDSFASSNRAASTPAQDVAAGLLPGPGNPCGYEHPVSVLTDATPGTRSDEGRAMAQVVHSVAPGAALAFASYGIDELTMHDAVLALAAAGATVIVDDVFLFGEPFYQPGAVGVAVEQVARQGVSYLTSAGNYNDVGEAGYPSAGYPVNGWATDAYRPTTCPAEVLARLAADGPGPYDCMDFSQGGSPDATDTLTLPVSTSPQSYSVQWAEPVGATQGTFALALTDPDGDTSVLRDGTANLPVLTGAVQLSDAGDYAFSIVRDLSAGPQAAVTPALTWLWSYTDIVAAEYFGVTAHDRVGSTIAGHGGLAAAISVAAVPSDAPGTVEDFSSLGPATQYFGYDPAVSAAAQPLPGPVQRAKPDLAGADRILTNFFSPSRPVDGRPGVHSFWGTSAAAPTVAGVVALGRQYSPATTAEQLRRTLTATAAEVSSGFPVVEAADAAGAGRVDATAFLAALPAPAPAPGPVPAVVPAGGGAQLAATGLGLPLSASVALAGLLTLALGAALLRRGRRPAEGRSPALRRPRSHPFG